MSWFYSLKGQVYRRGWARALSEREILGISGYMAGAARIAKAAGKMPLARDFDHKAENLAAAVADGLGWRIRSAA